MPNPSFTLLDLNALPYQTGRGVVFEGPYWDGTADIALTHLGDTEGDISIAPNETTAGLKLQELTGESEHNGFVLGAAPLITIPLVLATGVTRARVSPTGSASMGYKRRRPVLYRTLVVFPEQLFYDDVTHLAYEVLAYAVATWTSGGAALTTEQTRLLAEQCWAWKGYWQRPPITLRNDPTKPDVESCVFKVIQDSTKPDGHQLLTFGNPATAAIDIDYES